MATDTIPPSYMADSSPPSYDELVRRYEAAVGSSPTPQRCFAVANSFNETEIEILIKGLPIEEPPVGDGASLKLFKTRAAKALSQEYVQGLLQTSAENATEAALRLRTMFHEIHLKIFEIDAIHPSGFEPRVRASKTEFNSILDLSRRVALDIKNMGVDFDGRIIPIVLDDEVPLPAKRSRVATFLASANDHLVKSKDIKRRLQTLKITFTSLVGDFDRWAADKEGDLQREIQQLLAKLDDMQVELAKIDDKINVIKAARAISGILILAFLIPGPVGIALGIAGIIGIGASSVALAIYNKKRFEAEIHEKREKLRIIQTARTELLELRDAHMLRFGDDIEILDGFWQRIVADAEELAETLEDSGGEQPAEYVEFYYSEGIRICKFSTSYETLATYIGDYGNGISKVLETKLEEPVKA
ncbi:hypothetical protein LOZ58_005980 [Ophidiomyces ophidiicola]|nr:hypothetical protein LOZ58_005980 [Ophidiomyces ophidiicola]